MVVLKDLPIRNSWTNRVVLGLVCGVLAMSAGCASSQDPDEAEDMALNSSEYQSSDGDTEGTTEERLTAENNAAEQDFAGQPAPVENESAEVPPPPVPEEAALVAEGNAVQADPESVPEQSVTATNPDATSTSETSVDQAQEQAMTEAETPPTSEEIAATEATELLASEAPPEPAVIEAVPETSEVAQVEPAQTESAYLVPAVAVEEQTEPAIPPTPEPMWDSSGGDSAVAAAATPRERKRRAASGMGMSGSTAAAPRGAMSESPSSGQIEYLVAPGDSVIEIATRIYGSSREWQTIARANGLQAPYLIYPGDVLNIKVLDSASAFAQAYKSAPETQITVQKGDTLSSISQRLLGTATAWKYIWKINEASLPNPNQLRPGQTIRFRDYRGIQANL